MPRRTIRGLRSAVDSCPGLQRRATLGGGMPIREAGFSNFGPFADARVSCVEGLNVFIGENGTGKSHAMKAIYAVLETLRRAKAGKAKSLPAALRSEERRVGEEGRTRWAPYH